MRTCCRRERVWVLFRCAVFAWLGAVAYAKLLRPRIVNWGATEEEASRAMPGDNLVPDAALQTTRAISIDTPPEAVWPWLVQMGPKPRAGVYTYDWIERRLGIDIENSDRIMPEFQHLEPGEYFELNQKTGLKSDRGGAGEGAGVAMGAGAVDVVLRAVLGRTRRHATGVTQPHPGFGTGLPGVDGGDGAGVAGDGAQDAARDKRSGRPLAWRRPARELILSRSACVTGRRPSSRHGTGVRRPARELILSRSACVTGRRPSSHHAIGMVASCAIG